MVVVDSAKERGNAHGKKRANGEGNIRKRKDGRWEGRYTAGIDPETGKPIAKNVLAKTQRECKEKLRKAMEELEKIDVTKRRDYTVGEWAQLWYENYARPSVRASTAAYYKNYIDQHIMIVKQHGGVLPWAAMPLTAGNDRKKAAALISQNRRIVSDIGKHTKSSARQRFFSFPRCGGRCFLIDLPQA